MKHIAIRNFPNMKTREILLIVARTPEQGKGIAYDEMARRVRILDTLEVIDDYTAVIHMEDADHELLVKLLKAYPFAVADRNLLTILQDVVDAKTALPGANGGDASYAGKLTSSEI